MSIIIENEYEGEINIPYEKIAHEVIEAAIDYGLPLRVRSEFNANR